MTLTVSSPRWAPACPQISGSLATAGWAAWAGYPEAAELERTLGDPHREGNPYGFAAGVTRDRAGAFPAELAAAAHRAGLSLAFVPRKLGGTLDGFDATLALTRIAARRDTSVMPATMFSVTGATCVLLDGRPDQVERMVATLRAGRSVAFALSEPQAGSDLTANQVTLQGDPGNRRLDGAKWLVGTGDRAGLLYVVARTAPRGMAAFTAALLEVDTIPDGALHRSPAGATGLTGIDLTGLHFDGCPVPETDLVGEVGHGLATAMRGMQVVRLLSTAANLSCADVTVRTVLEQLEGVRRGQGLVIDWPYTRRELGRIAAALIAMDAVAITTARSAHVAPAALSLWSAVAKRTVNELSRDLNARCADLAASRGVLAEGPGALLAKVRRDTEVIRYIDTTPVSTLRLLALQLAGVVQAGPTGADLDAVFDLGADLPEFDPDRLDLAVRGADPVTEKLADAQEHILAVLTADANPLGRSAAELVGRLLQELEQVRAVLRKGRADRSGAAECAMLDAAARYSQLHAAISCLLLWWANRKRSLWGRPPGDVGWLSGVLAFLIDEGAGRPVTPEALEPVTGLFFDLAHRGLLFSAVPIPLTDHGRTPGRVS